MNDRIRYVLALVVGLLAIPGLAFATNSALSSDETDQNEEVLGTVAVRTATADPTSISAEDLVRACGVEGRYLVDLESAGATDDIQQAALNALRPICEDAGLPLPGAPVVTGETIVETVTVVRTVPGPVAAGTSTTTSTSLAGQDDDDDAAEAFSAAERALTAINTAREVAGDPEKINEAIALLSRGNAAYEAGDYDEAEELYEAAEHKAIEAQQQLQAHGDDHEDDEDDDHEDEHHEDDDHEDDD